MDVVDRLAGVVAAVHDQAISVRCDIEFAGQMFGDGKQMSCELLIPGRQVVHARDRFPRHDEDVNGCLRIDIMKGNALFVFIHDVGVNLTVSYFLKQSSFSHESSSICEQ